MPIVLRIVIGSKRGEKAGPSSTIVRVIEKGRADCLVVDDEVKKEGTEFWLEVGRGGKRGGEITKRAADGLVGPLGHPALHPGHASINIC